MHYFTCLKHFPIAASAPVGDLGVRTGSAGLVGVLSNGHGRVQLFLDDTHEPVIAYTDSVSEFGGRTVFNRLIQLGREPVRVWLKDGQIGDLNVTRLSHVEPAR